MRYERVVIFEIGYHQFNYAIYGIQSLGVSATGVFLNAMELIFPYKN